jgi:endogenous inhibitor of DNA gyrase (YacG/DUF329 family)
MSASPEAPAAKPAPLVRCPSCGEKHPYRLDNPYRPFCSRGCQAIDLGAWATEQYRMEAKPNEQDLSDHLGD